MENLEELGVDCETKSLKSKSHIMIATKNSSARVVVDSPLSPTDVMALYNKHLFTVKIPAYHNSVFVIKKRQVALFFVGDVCEDETGR